MKIPAWKSWNHVALTPAYVIKHKLFQDLVRAYAAAHGFDPYVRYITGSRLESDLPHMAVFLRQQGWLISWYRMPPGLGYRNQIDVISMGVVLNPVCNKLIAWRLSHA
jgi:hypothetical protein